MFITAFPLSNRPLRAPANAVRHLKKAARVLSRLSREEMGPAEMILSDHGPFLLGEAQGLVRRTRKGPGLPGGDHAPRILEWARRVVEAGEGRVTASLVVRTAREEFSTSGLMQKEIDLMQEAVRCALMERIDEGALRCLRQNALRRQARRWARRFAAGKEGRLPLDAQVCALGLGFLSEGEDAAALARADRLGAAPPALSAPDPKELTLGPVIASLDALGRLPWARIAQRLSPAEAVLRREDTFRRMDSAGRSLYLRQVAHIARRFGLSEEAVAQAALELSQEKEDVQGEAGYYLLEAPHLIARHLGRRAHPRPHAVGLFLLPLYAGAGLSLLGAIAAGVPALLWLPLMLCVSQLLRALYFPLLRRMYPARPLPRLHLAQVDGARRTLVAVPTLLTSPKQALRMARHLAVLRCANPDEGLDFLLLADFADSKAETDPQDQEIVQAATEAIRALNGAHGPHFFYLHRARQWSGQVFSGRERKRGALEMLNRLIAGGIRTDPVAAASFDLDFFKNRYTYVITLDADTFLPPGAARKLVGALSHPLQKDRVGVIQPRMEVAANTVRTHVQAFLGGRGGSDLYGFASQDAYQDVLGRGSFAGKGIYCPDQWLRRLEGRLPQGQLLSHDLIEGEIVGSALASDIVLYDGHPQALAGWEKRLHRWTRGDWQLLPFLWDKRLDLLSRHKIWDNLRRSLVPAAQTVVLLAALALRMPLLALPALPWPLRGMGARLSLLPGKSWCLMDAAFRAVYRLFVSRKHLLSWVTAAQTEGGRVSPPLLLFQIAAGCAATGLSLLPGGLWPGAFIGISWLVMPLLAPLLDRPLRPAWPMTKKQQEVMRALARDTWRFFEDSVNETTLFLPPDNVQCDPPRGAAMRTSPTNIGLYLLSCCAAREMGMITTAVLCRRLWDALVTLEQLDTWKGHYYNWYDLTDGTPLAPAFVSTVDSGNLAGCLFACAQLCRQRLKEMPEAMRALPEKLDGLFERMDFSPLYDPREQLFFVGWNTDKNKPTAAHYDLLASEARLASFLAVMRGQAPLRHWKRLGRETAYAGGGPALLSWGGTMFEYLMPHLLLPLVPGTLMGEGCLCAVRAQMAYQPLRPFGISESGYAAFDPDMNYQYRAFGLPALALSGETNGQVISPYASLLALPFFPRAVADNALRMMRLQWANDHGFWEAADYAPASPRPRLVYSHMAHHQGMILCALCNALEKDVLVRAFTATPRAQAFAYLLMEPAPRTTSRRPSWQPPRNATSLPGPCRRMPEKSFPLQAQALSTGRLTWTLSARGQGFLQWKEYLLTRFDPDAEDSGLQIYVKDCVSGALVRPAAEGVPRFESGSAHFRHELSGVHIQLSCCAAPVKNAAVARLTLENTGKEPREIAAVSFLEVALGRMEDDRAHPNFRDLGVRIVPWGSQGLLAQRLSREGEEDMPCIGHFALGDYQCLSRQGDKDLFLGRLGSYAAPAQLLSADTAYPLRTGDTTAPCLSLQLSVALAPGEKKTVFFITLPRESDAPPVPTLLRPGVWQEAFSLAFAQDQTLLRALGMDEHSLKAYQTILGAVLFSGQPHQTSPLAASSGALWRLGVSGRDPVWMVLFQEADRLLLRHALRCHAWLRAMGVSTDLIVFCPPEAQYRQPLREEAMHMISVSSARQSLGVPGGVTVVSGTREEAMEAASLCRLVLRSGAPLSAQLAACAFSSMAKNTVPAVSRPLVPVSLQPDHAFGGFTEEGDYAVVRPAPVPWHNVLCNPRFGTLVCETGILHSYVDNSRLGRLTASPGDVCRPVPAEDIYWLDDRNNACSLTAPAAVHSPGVTQYRSQCGPVASELTVFAHARETAGIRVLTLRSEKDVRLKVRYAVRFALGERPEFTRCQTGEGIAFARQGDMPLCAFAAMEQSRVALLPARLYQSLVSPNVPFMPGGSVALLTREIFLPAHGQMQLTLILGCAADEALAQKSARRLFACSTKDMERQTRLAWMRRLDRLALFSGARDGERMMNRFLPYQTWASRLFARMGPYQNGGALGFRDQLQDLLIPLYTDPAWAREHLILCAAHQYVQGDVQHWWHPPRKGVRTRISDDRLFLPYLLAKYVKITGDTDILSVQAPYLDSPSLQPEEQDRYEDPAVTASQESLLQHGIRAVDSMAYGDHGLPLMAGGDWNDGMNRVGGESVWLSFFLAVVLKDFMPLCPQETRDRYRALHRKLLDGAESAWTGQWYLRAWYRDGRPLGGPDTDPPRIDLISQVFSVLAGAPRAHARTAVQWALRLLHDPQTATVRLLSPAFTPREKAGYIGAYLPGVRENGGQYTHAVPWLILALHKIGDDAAAWRIAREQLPMLRSRTDPLRYRVEPYVLAGDIYAGENAGRGGWTWYTGSAAWLYYAVLTALLGFDKRGDRARLTPAPGSGWEEFTLVYCLGSARYHFTASQDVVFATLDGEKLPEGWVEMRDDGKTHEARFPLKP